MRRHHNRTNMLVPSTRQSCEVTSNSVQPRQLDQQDSSLLPRVLSRARALRSQPFQPFNTLWLLLVPHSLKFRNFETSSHGVFMCFV
jgi:hypothetical protein